jgi:AraC-like DNA-binding protein
MDASLFAELQALIARHAAPDGTPLAALPSVTVMAADAPAPPLPHVAEPMFALVAQGAKRIGLGTKVFDYGAGEYLIVSVDLPLDAYVVVATADALFLGLGFTLKPEAIATLLLETGTAQPARADPPGIAVSDLTTDLVDPVVRLLRLLDQPADIPVLAPALEREILWRLIKGPQGAMVRQIGLADSRMAQVARAIRWIRGHYAEAIRIETLARIAGMSVTSFHRHFRGVTSMTPIQYQQRIRLQAARSRLMSSGEDVATVGLAVGYDSASQFSREYRRLFGAPPGRDGARLRRSNEPGDAAY